MMDRKAWHAAVYGITKSWTWLSDWTELNWIFNRSDRMGWWLCRTRWRRWRYQGDSAAAAKLLQSCPTLCNPIDGSPPGSSVPGILQATILEWVAISSSNAWKWKVKVKSLSRVRLVATSRTAAHQAPPSMGFSRQEYWSGVPLPSPKVILVLFFLLFFFEPLMTLFPQMKIWGGIDF